MNELDAIKQRIEKQDKLIEAIGLDQHASSKALNEIQNSIKNIELYIKGDKSVGIPGIINSFQSFKRDFELDYIKDQNFQSEKNKGLNDRITWAEGRIKTLEEVDKQNGNRIGKIIGISVILGGFLAWLAGIIHDVVQ